MDEELVQDQMIPSVEKLSDNVLDEVLDKVSDDGT